MSIFKHTVYEQPVYMITLLHHIPKHLSFRYCVLLITGDEESYTIGNQAFLTFASTNTLEVVRFAYVYQRLQQSLCDILLKTKDSTPPPPQVSVC